MGLLAKTKIQHDTTFIGWEGMCFFFYLFWRFFGATVFNNSNTTTTILHNRPLTVFYHRWERRRGVFSQGHAFCFGYLGRANLNISNRIIIITVLVNHAL
jgi:hypothetical protein